MSQDRDISGWLAELGYGLPGAMQAARVALEEAKLTHAGKQRMSEEKLPRASEALRARFFLHCSSAECARYAAASGRQPVLASEKPRCERCGGSDNQRAATEFLEASRRRQVSKVVVVGGSPGVREELEATLGRALQLRLVDGTERRTAEKAHFDLEWADLVLVWGGSELHHKVSLLYTAVPPALKRKVLIVPKRGVAALLAAGVEHLARG